MGPVEAVVLVGPPLGSRAVGIVAIGEDERLALAVIDQKRIFELRSAHRTYRELAEDVGAFARVHRHQLVRQGQSAALARGAVGQRHRSLGIVPPGFPLDLVVPGRGVEVGRVGGQVFADAVEVAVALVAPPRDEKAHVPVERHRTAERAFEGVRVQIDAGGREEKVLVARHIITAVEAHRSREAIAAFFGDQIDDAGHRPAVLGVKSTRDDGHLLDGVGSHPRGDAVGAERVRHREAIDQIRDLVATPAPDVQRAVGALRDTRLRSQHPEEALDRQRIDLLGNDRLLRGRQVFLDEGPLGLHDDLLPLDHLFTHPQIRAGSLARRDAHVGDTLRLKADVGEDERVGAGPHIEDHVIAVHVGDSALLHALDENVDADERLAVTLVGHAPGNLALPVSRERRPARQDQQPQRRAQPGAYRASRLAAIEIRHA